MEKIFLDTSFLFAYYNADDEDHDEAVSLSIYLSQNNIVCVISDYIIDELLTLLSSRVGKSKAIKLCNDLIDDIKDGFFILIYIDYDIFNETLRTFIQFKDKERSFTDCTSYTIIKKDGIDKAISFDEHFRQFGIEILP
ncbi:TPA: PIN domain-containing protein [bacterium]|nr:PIN domain-containing protein [bacterium]